MHRPARTIAILATTQIISWGSVYYAFSVLAPVMGRELGLASNVLYGAFSWSILVAGLAATPVGLVIDRMGGQRVMALGSLISGLGLFWLAHSGGTMEYLGAWTLLGFGMALSLYEAAFAAINRKDPLGARRSISTLTLFAGFASTIFWPLTAQLTVILGWRHTYLAFACLQLMVCLPLHWLLGRDTRVGLGHAQAASGNGSTLSEAIRHPAFWALSGAFAANAFIFSAMSVHLIPLIQQLGHAGHLAVLLAAMIGPMQVIGRLIERGGAQKLTPQAVGKLTFAGLPAALLALVLFGREAWAVAMFCVLYGLTNGVLTILRGTLPQAMFGSAHYGAIAGAMAGPALIAKAAGPLALAFALSGAPDPSPILWVLLGVAVVSYLLYLTAVAAQRRRQGGAVPCEVKAL